MPDENETLAMHPFRFTDLEWVIRKLREASVFGNDDAARKRRIIAELQATADGVDSDDDKPPVYENEAQRVTAENFRAWYREQHKAKE